MYRKWLLAAGVVDLFILSLLDKIAFKYYFYWKYDWFDIIMHLAGGLAIGLVSTAAYLGQAKDNTRTAGNQAVSLSRIFIFCLSFAVVIGIIWELFELAADRIVKFNWLDTTGDITAGILGSLAAGLLAGIIALWINQKGKK